MHSNMFFVVGAVKKSLYPVDELLLYCDTTTVYSCQYNVAQRRAEPWPIDACLLSGRVVSIRSAKISVMASLACKGRPCIRYCSTADGGLPLPSPARSLCACPWHSARLLPLPCALDMTCGCCFCDVLFCFVWRTRSGLMAYSLFWFGCVCHPHHFYFFLRRTLGKPPAVRVIHPKFMLLLFCIES